MRLHKLGKFLTQNQTNQKATSNELIEFKAEVMKKHSLQTLKVLETEFG